MADFTFPIHRMTPEAPEYNVVSTEMEGTKKKRRLKSSEPKRKWTVEIRARINSERDAILSHYNGQSGTFTPFYWVVPSFFGGQTYYVTYESMSYENPDGLGNVWNFTIVFVEEMI